MQSNIYGYVRVSTKEQCEERQIIALRKFPVAEKNTFMDKLSGKDFNRPGYRRLLNRLNAGDLLVVKSIDRLGRNYDEILEQWRIITKEKQADIVVLDMPLLDTRVRSDSLVGRFIADVVLQVLSFVAENEREKIRARQAEGIRLAKQRGVRFGRPSFLYTDEFLSVADDYLGKRIRLQTALQRLAIKRDNFYYHIRKLRAAGRGGGVREDAAPARRPAAMCAPHFTVSQSLRQYGDMPSSTATSQRSRSMLSFSRPAISSSRLMSRSLSCGWP